MDGEKAPAPEHLSERAKQLWNRIVESDEIDAIAAEILLTFCEAVDRRDDARRVVQLEGALIKDRFGVLKINPAVTVERDSTLIMHRAFRLLGYDQAPKDVQGRFNFQ